MNLTQKIVVGFVVTNAVLFTASKAISMAERRNEKKLQRTIIDTEFVNIVQHY